MTTMTDRIRAVASPRLTAGDIAKRAGIDAKTTYEILCRERIPYKRVYGQGPRTQVQLSLPPDLMAWLEEDCPEGRPMTTHIREILRGVKADSERKVRG